MMHVITSIIGELLLYRPWHRISEYRLPIEREILFWQWDLLLEFFHLCTSLIGSLFSRRNQFKWLVALYSLLFGVLLHRFPHMLTSNIPCVDMNLVIDGLKFLFHAMKSLLNYFSALIHPNLMVLNYFHMVMIFQSLNWVENFNFYKNLKLCFISYLSSLIFWTTDKVFYLL